MRHSTLRQLEVFSAIARLGSFTRAAEELFLTQPTVSMQIKKLTDAVGLLSPMPDVSFSKPVMSSSSIFPASKWRSPT